MRARKPTKLSVMPCPPQLCLPPAPLLRLQSRGADPTLLTHDSPPYLSQNLGRFHCHGHPATVAHSYEVHTCRAAGLTPLC
jgi:hypothetical protein